LLKDQKRRGRIAETVPRNRPLAEVASASQTDATVRSGRHGL